MGTKNPNQTLLQSAHQSASDKTPAPLAGSSSEVGFAFRGVQPPSTLYVDVDDQLVMQAATSQTSEVVTVNVRLLLPNGRIEDMQFTIRPLSARAVLRQSQALAQGFILSVSATAAIAITRGQTFLRISTQRSASGVGFPAQMLFADYVTTQSTSAYPNGRVLSPTEGPGFIRGFALGNPAPGSDFALSVPSNARWRVRCLTAFFVASATVANRNVQIEVQQNTLVEWIGTDAVAITAGQSIEIISGPLTPSASVITANHYVPIPPDTWLMTNTAGSGIIASLTQNIQVGDQWSQISALIEEWLENV